MAKDVVLKKKLRGLNKLMTSPKAAALARRAAANVATKAGPKFEIVDRPHKWTAGAVVRPVKGESISDEEQRGMMRAATENQGWA